MIYMMGGKSAFFRSESRLCQQFTHWIMLTGHYKGRIEYVGPPGCASRAFICEIYCVGGWWE